MAAAGDSRDETGVHDVGMASRIKRSPRRPTGNHDVKREPGIDAAGRYLRLTGAPASGAPVPVIGRHVGMTVALCARIKTARRKTQDGKRQDRMDEDDDKIPGEYAYGKPSMSRKIPGEWACSRRNTVC